MLGLNFGFESYETVVEVEVIIPVADGVLKIGVIEVERALGQTRSPLVLRRK
jgi:hypothetical protein